MKLCDCKAEVRCFVGLFGNCLIFSYCKRSNSLSTVFAEKIVPVILFATQVTSFYNKHPIFISDMKSKLTQDRFSHFLSLHWVRFLFTTNALKQNYYYLRESAQRRSPKINFILNICSILFE